MKKKKNKQMEIFDYIKKEIRTKGYGPTVREICEAVSLSSPSTVHGYLEKLEKEGLIRRDPAKPRTIVVVEDEQLNTRVNHVPLLGKVTAGEPITAIENIEGYIPLPANIIDADGDMYALTVQGDSMIDIGIFDGDYVFVKKQPYAENGDIVVAMIDDSATVKRFFKEKDHFRLQPENSHMSPIITKEVEVLGIVKGLLRVFR